MFLDEGAEEVVHGVKYCLLPDWGEFDVVGVPGHDPGPEFGIEAHEVDEGWFVGGDGPGPVWHGVGGGVWEGEGVWVELLVGVVEDCLVAAVGVDG